MSSPAANKRKGAAFEIALMKGLRERGLDVERLRLAGKDDEGDLAIRYADFGWTTTYKVIEAKSGALHPAAFIREMETERENFARARDIPLDLVDGLVVVKAPRQPILRSYVLTTLDRYLNMED